MEQPTLVVMAAGMGSRYGGLKQVDPLGPNGEMILDYSVHDAVQAGFGKVVFVIKRENEALFHEKLGSALSKKIEVAYAFQELDDLPGGYPVPEGRQRPWGTGHAVYAARKAVSGPFSVVNADDFVGRDSFLQLGRFCREGCAPDKLAMVGFRVDNALSGSGGVSRGVCRVEDGMLRSVEERIDIRRDASGVIACDGEAGRTALADSSPVSMNVWAFHSAIYDRMEEDLAAWLAGEEGDPLKREYFLPAFVDRLMKSGQAQVRVLPTAARWYGVTHQADREQMQRALRAFHDRGEYPALRGPAAL